MYNPYPYHVRVLAPQEPESTCLIWRKDYQTVAGGVAWGVFDNHGREIAIYDCVTLACDGRNLLNTPPMEIAR